MNCGDIVWYELELNIDDGRKEIILLMIHPLARYHTSNTDIASDFKLLEKNIGSILNSNNNLINNPTTKNIGKGSFFWAIHAYYTIKNWIHKGSLIKLEKESKGNVEQYSAFALKHEGFGKCKSNIGKNKSNERYIPY